MAFQFESFHYGGDEVNLNCWNSSASVTKPMQDQNISLKEEGFIQSVEEIGEAQSKQLLVSLKYKGKTREPIITALKRVSKPGLRIYAPKKELPRVLGGLGIAIISTSQGVMTDTQARNQNLGGEVLCYIW